MGNFFEPHFAGEQCHRRRDELAHGDSGGVSASFEAVLEAKCAALLALEASRERMRFLPGEHGTAEADVGEAIDLLQHAMAELRAHVAGARPSLLSLGFVVRDEDAPRVSR